MKRLLLALTCLLPFAVSAEPVSLVFAGDIVLVGQPGKLIAEGHDPFRDVENALGADIRVANLECVVATTGSAEDKIFTFRADPHTLPLLLISKARMLADRVPPRKPQLARYPLYEAIRLSERITDPRQLARAYKGIGDVYGLLGNNSERRAWRKKAATVPGIAEDTRAKLR